jgi:hypothetical protein
MHDPLHVVLSIRRPPLRRPRRPMERDPLPAFAFWRLRDRVTVGRDGQEQRTPLRRRIMFSGAFFRLGRWEWYLPSVLTVWHRDPGADGTDSSCRNAARARRQAAIKSHRFLAAAWWDWWWRHYDVFHVHHWTIQFDLAQELRRWALTRCETCGGRQTRGRAINFHVVVDRDAEDRRRGKRSFRERWLTGERNLHHHDCSAIASLRATKASLPGWLRSYGRDESAMRMQREREPYMGCYAWWRELILGEPPHVAAALAAAHVQRSVHPCPDCEGSGRQRVLVPDHVASPRAVLGQLLTDSACARCEGTGHERVEHPVPAELV